MLSRLDQFSDLLVVQLRRWVVPLFVLLPLVACCSFTGLWGSLPGLRNVYIDHLDYVEGVVEPVAPSQWRPFVYAMSPNGAQLLLSWQRRGYEREWVLLNTATSTFITLPLKEIIQAHWLSNEQLAAYGEFPGNYVLIDAATGTVRSITAYPEEAYLFPGGMAKMEEVFRQAQAVYLLQPFDTTSVVKVLTVDAKDAYLFSLGTAELQTNNNELITWLRTIPHDDITLGGFTVPKPLLERRFSHNGKLYAEREGDYYYYLPSGFRERLWLEVIRTKDEVKVAEVFKSRWIPKSLGWDRSNEWLYFLAFRRGQVDFPETPVFRLRPYTPAEEAWASGWRTARQVGWWAGVLFLLGLLVRRLKHN